MRGNKRGIIIQERDRGFLRKLATFRIVDREQAKVIAGFGSTTRANTRLLALTQAGLVRRFFLAGMEGNKKAIYALSTKGAALVGVIPRGLRRPQNELLIADFSTLHQLTANDIYCELKRPIPGVSLTRWLSFHEPLAENLRLIPDGYLELRTPAGTIAAFLEVDLGHERPTVWAGKIKNYVQLALSGDFGKFFGQDHFRVLVAANSERRLLSIRKLVRAATQKIFWFTTLESVHREGIFAPIWFRPDGDEPHFLFPHLQSLQ